jgi:hypothetical protein
MSTTTVTIPQVEVQLSVDQLITAAKQLDPGERAKLARALAETDLDVELTRLMVDLYSKPPVDDISDEEIQAEIQAVRQQNT